MAKKIEDFVVDLSYAELGVQVVVEIDCPEQFKGINHPHIITTLSTAYGRFKAISNQVKRAIGFAGCLNSIELSGYNRDFNTIQLQLSYQIGIKGDKPKRKGKKKGTKKC